MKGRFWSKDKRESIKGLAILIAQIGILSSSTATVIIGYNSERNLIRHNQLPEALKPYDSNKDGYMSPIELRLLPESYNVKIK